MLGSRAEICKETVNAPTLLPRGTFATQQHDPGAAHPGICLSLHCRFTYQESRATGKTAQALRVGALINGLHPPGQALPQAAFSSGVTPFSCGGVGEGAGQPAGSSWKQKERKGKWFLLVLRSSYLLTHCV